MNTGIYCETFGNTPRNAILEYFLSLDKLDHALSDIAKEIELSKATVYNTAAILEAEKIIVKGRRIGNTQLYILNKESRLTVLLINVFNELLLQEEALTH